MTKVKVEVCSICKKEDCSDTDILTSDLVDELINSIPKSYKNLWEGSRTNLTPEGAYTEIRHDNKIIGLCHPEVFLRLVDYCAN